MKWDYGVTCRPECVARIRSDRMVPNSQSHQQVRRAMDRYTGYHRKSHNIDHFLNFNHLNMMGHCYLSYVLKTKSSCTTLAPLIDNYFKCCGRQRNAFHIFSASLAFRRSTDSQQLRHSNHGPTDCPQVGTLLTLLAP